CPGGAAAVPGRGLPGATLVSPRSHWRVAQAFPPRNIPPHSDDARCRGGCDARSAPQHRPRPQSAQTQRAGSTAPITSNGTRVFNQPPKSVAKNNPAEPGLAIFPPELLDWKDFPGFLYINQLAVLEF